VVPRAQGAYLGDAPLLGLGAHLGGVRGLHAAPFLRALQVLVPTIAVLDGPLRPCQEDVLYLGGHNIDDALGAHSGRDVLKKRADQVLDARANVLLLQVGAHQADPAVGYYQPVRNEVVRVRDREIVDQTLIRDSLYRDDVVIQETSRFYLLKLSIQELLERDKVQRYALSSPPKIMPFDKACADLIAPKELLHLPKLQPFILQVLGPLCRRDPSLVEPLLEEDVSGSDLRHPALVTGVLVTDSPIEPYQVLFFRTD